jgi:hypothetical protein
MIIKKLRKRGLTMLLVDTSVLIDYLRGRNPAA